MRRILLAILIVTLRVVNSNAQEADSVQYQPTEISIDSLAVKLNTLQRDCDYWYCNYELMRGCLELNDFSNSISISSNSILISYYNTKFDIDLYTVYLELYNSYVRKLNALKVNMDATKLLVTSKVVTSNFTEQEIKLISSNLELIDRSMSTVNSSLEYLKVVIDAYKSSR